MESDYILALRAVLSGLSQRKVASMYHVSRNTIAVLKRYAKQQGWDSPKDLNGLSEDNILQGLTRAMYLGAREIKATNFRTMSMSTRS